MKNLLLLVIKIYWIVIPENKRRTCLFKQSCSHFVFSNTQEFGLLKGIKALQYRISTCKEGAGLFLNPLTGKIQMILPNNEILEEQYISETILNQHLLNISK